MAISNCFGSHNLFALAVYVFTSHIFDIANSILIFFHLFWHSYFAAILCYRRSSSMTMAAEKMRFGYFFTLFFTLFFFRFSLFSLFVFRSKTHTRTQPNWIFIFSSYFFSFFMMQTFVVCRLWTVWMYERHKWKNTTHTPRFLCNKNFWLNDLFSFFLLSFYY